MVNFDTLFMSVKYTKKFCKICPERAKTSARSKLKADQTRTGAAAAAAAAAAATFETGGDVSHFILSLPGFNPEKLFSLLPHRRRG
jgi:hypothetical protein